MIDEDDATNGPMRPFRMKADCTFKARNIDDAVMRLGLHFLTLCEDYAAEMGEDVDGLTLEHIELCGGSIEITLHPEPEMLSSDHASKG